jgi:hypothetical protein
MARIRVLPAWVNVIDFQNVSGLKDLYAGARARRLPIGVADQVKKNSGAVSA